MRWSMLAHHLAMERTKGKPSELEEPNDKDRENKPGVARWSGAWCKLIQTNCFILSDESSKRAYETSPF